MQDVKEARDQNSDGEDGGHDDLGAQDGSHFVHLFDDGGGRDADQDLAVGHADRGPQHDVAGEIDPRRGHAVGLARALVARDGQLAHSETVEDLDVVQDKTVHEALVDEASDVRLLIADAVEIDAVLVRPQLRHLRGNLLGLALGQVEAARQEPHADLAECQLDRNSDQNGQQNPENEVRTDRLAVRRGGESKTKVRGNGRLGCQSKLPYND